MTLNVLVIGKFYIEGWATHIAETLTLMGHKVEKVDPGLSLFSGSGNIKKLSNAFFDIYQRTPFYEEKLAKRLAQVVDDRQIQLVIACHDFLTPGQARAIKQVGDVKLALWFPDAVLNFGKSMFLAGDYDRLYFKDTYLVDRIKRDYGLPAFYLPECCNPRRHGAVSLTAKDIKKYACDITTAGNLNSHRLTVFSHLSGYNVKIWGVAPPFWIKNHDAAKFYQNEFVAHEEKAKAFLAAKIVLNTIHLSEINGVNVRTFEIAAAGAFQLATHKPDVKDLFLEGEEIITFNSIEDLKEKVKFYIDKEDLRNEIAQKARIRVLAEHTYEKRLKKIIDDLF